MQIQDIMAPGVVSITPQESVALAARLLARHNVGALPVCSGAGDLVGMVTDRDITLRCVAAGKDPRNTPVQKIMTHWPAAVAPADDVRLAARAMARGQVRRLPVVKGKTVVGMVSLGDLARCGQFEMETAQALTDISENVRRV